MRKRGRKKSLFADRSNLTALYVLLFYFVTIHNLFLDLVTPQPSNEQGQGSSSNFRLCAIIWRHVLSVAPDLMCPIVDPCPASYVINMRSLVTVPIQYEWLVVVSYPVCPLDPFRVRT